MGDYNGMSEQKEGPQKKCAGAMFELDLTSMKVADDVWKKILDNGGKVAMELKVQSWGGYYGTAMDPFGYEWALYAPLDKKEDSEQK